MVDIAFIKATADGIAALLYPDLEAVVHDLSSGRIAHIANGFSRRKVGDESLITDLAELDAGPDVVGPYEKTGLNSRQLRSISLVARAANGEPNALLCLNFDVTALAHVQKLLSGFAVGQQSQVRPESLFSGDWREKLNEIIETLAAANHLKPADFGRGEIIQVLVQAREHGLLDVRNFVEYVGDYFKISRASVYNYLRAAAAQS
ncbi:helix-turn-helix transcriptional regulator [Pseudomonas sp. D3]|nr:PAS domain-containing protein [Pseudomonas sp. D3]WET10075.1 PAS domain-containing protein [Pseudomonas sp. D3]